MALGDVNSGDGVSSAGGEENQEKQQQPALRSMHGPTITLGRMIRRTVMRIFPAHQEGVPLVAISYDHGKRPAVISPRAYTFLITQAVAGQNKELAFPHRAARHSRERAGLEDAE